jgi:hypothetical protein
MIGRSVLVAGAISGAASSPSGRSGYALRDQGIGTDVRLQWRILVVIFRHASG